MYQMQEESVTFLFHYPFLNSLLESSLAKGWGQHSTPADKEGKKLDSFGRWLYLAGALGRKSCNFMVCMAHFMHPIFEDMVPYLNILPEVQKMHLLHLQTEGLAAAKQEIAYAKHTLETAAKMLTMAVVFQ